ncbi:hypothetical protein HYR99_01425 [Candidatus Poribacteria bacterium]|nr:hypothetical protein [Candidatus Poribacteria bacterium]
MSNIHYLQNQLNKAQAILEQYEQKHKDEPQNFAVELSLLSMREHIKDLQEQIRCNRSGGPWNRPEDGGSVTPWEGDAPAERKVR